MKRARGPEHRAESNSGRKSNLMAHTCASPRPPAFPPVSGMAFPHWRQAKLGTHAASDERRSRGSLTEHQRLPCDTEAALHHSERILFPRSFFLCTRQYVSTLGISDREWRPDSHTCTRFQLAPPHWSTAAARTHPGPESFVRGGSGAQSKNLSVRGVMVA